MFWADRTVGYQEKMRVLSGIGNAYRRASVAKSPMTAVTAANRRASLRSAAVTCRQVDADEKSANRPRPNTTVAHVRLCINWPILRVGYCSLVRIGSKCRRDTRCKFLLDFRSFVTEETNRNVVDSCFVHISVICGCRWQYNTVS